MSLDVDYLITVGAADAKVVADRLRAAGAQVVDVLEGIGVIRARGTAAHAEQLARVPGVAGVETERRVHVAPPGSRVQ